MLSVVEVQMFYEYWYLNDLVTPGQIVTSLFDPWLATLVCQLVPFRYMHVFQILYFIRYN